jgi:(E)-4-hydroxy-3-methylbut-2-enyl-diphosphate synthase
VIGTVNALESRLEDIIEPMDVAVIGCCVNGPGEAREATIGLAGGSPSLLYVGGKPDRKVTSENIVDEMERSIRAQLKARAETSAPVPVIPIKAVS